MASGWHVIYRRLRISESACASACAFAFICSGCIGLDFKTQTSVRSKLAVSTKIAHDQEKALALETE